jgi:spore coat polysaccharide biosynthesis predicted glycosyltransferase SpsG
LRIAIVTDGNQQLGMGHVYQSITLAGHLLRQAGPGTELEFLTRSGDAVVELLRSSGCRVSAHADDDSIFECLRAWRPDRIVFDKLDVAPALAERISVELGAKLAILTNLSEANRYADLTVMAGMGSRLKNLRTEADGQVRLWGPRYWLLRPDFFDRPAKRPGPVRKLLLIFGGADQANLSSRVLAELLAMPEPFDITLVLGALFEHRRELDALLAGHDGPATVRVVSKLERVAEAMHDSDLAFVSPGLSFFEALSVGTPVICFHQNSFQQQAWQGLVKTYDRSETGMVAKLVRERSFIFPDDPDIVAMEAGRGAAEIVAEILS